MFPEIHSGVSFPTLVPPNYLRHWADTRNGPARSMPHLFMTGWPLFDFSSIRDRDCGLSLGGSRSLEVGVQKSGSKFRNMTLDTLWWRGLRVATFVFYSSRSLLCRSFGNYHCFVWTFWCHVRKSKIIRRRLQLLQLIHHSQVSTSSVLFVTILILYIMKTSASELVRMD